jgi:hypothetical protein
MKLKLLVFMFIFFVSFNLYSQTDVKVLYGEWCSN